MTEEVDQPAVDVSVLIATRNRAEHIGPSLEAVLASASTSALPTEVVVVNNASSDGTAGVLAGYAARWPILRLIEDPIPGKSGALNRALPQLKGRAVVFTDDDVHVPKSWVYDMATPILRGEADAVSGRVVLADHLARPWLNKDLRVYLAEMLDVSGGGPGMVGANMAAARDVAMAIGFDEELGAGGLGMAEDVLFNLRLKAAGHRLVGCTGPPVEHHFDPSRLSYASMRELAQRNGSSHAYLWHHWLGSDLRFLNIRRMRSAVLLLWASRKRWTLGPSGISPDEYNQFFKLSFFAHMAHERSRPRHY